MRIASKLQLITQPYSLKKQRQLPATSSSGDFLWPFANLLVNFSESLGRCLKTNPKSQSISNKNEAVGAKATEEGNRTVGIGMSDGRLRRQLTHYLQQLPNLDLQSQNMQQQQSKVNLLDDNYEIRLQCPHSFTHPTLSQDLQPDESDQAMRPVSSKFISKQGITKGTQASNIEIDSFFGDSSGSTSLNVIPADPQKPEDQDPQEESTQVTNSHTPSSRSDDNNNAHKKFITFLNRCLKLAEKKTIKEKLSGLNAKKDSFKGSRYGFSISLLNIRYLLGEDRLLQIYQRFKEKIGPFIQTQKKNAQAKEFLLRSQNHCVKSFHQMIKGEIEQSVKVIYRSNEDFKQQRYLEKGIKKVLHHQQLLNRKFPIRPAHSHQ